MTVYIVVSDDSLAFSTYIGCEGISAISLNYIVHSTGEDGIQKTEYGIRNTEDGIRNTEYPKQAMAGFLIATSLPGNGLFCYCNKLQSLY